MLFSGVFIGFSSWLELNGGDFVCRANLGLPKASYNTSCYSLSIHIVVVLNFVSALTAACTLAYDISAALPVL